MGGSKRGRKRANLEGDVFDLVSANRVHIIMTSTGTKRKPLPPLPQIHTHVRDTADTDNTAHATHTTHTSLYMFSAPSSEASICTATRHFNGGRQHRGEGACGSRHPPQLVVAVPERRVGVRPQVPPHPRRRDGRQETIAPARDRHVRGLQRMLRGCGGVVKVTTIRRKCQARVRI